MRTKSKWSPGAGVKVLGIALQDAENWVVSAAAKPVGICPDCGTRSRHRHGWHNRKTLHTTKTGHDPDTSRRERNREAREAPEQPERRPPRGNVEVVVFSTLAKCGNLKHEQPLPSGAMPDILFQSRDVNFVADITCVSDDGLDELNPYEEFFRLVSDLKTNLGLPGGGLDVRIASDRDVSFCI